MAEQGAVDAVSASTVRALKESSAALGVGYPRLAEIQQWPAARWREVLAVVRFSSGVSARLPFTPAEDIPVVQVCTPAIDAAGEATEVWHLPGPMYSGQMGRVRYRHNGRLLFACLSISETEFVNPIAAATTVDAGYALRRATEAGYRELFSAIEALHFAHPLRIWNFMPEINAAGLNGERYWYFNGARQDAFLGFKRCIAGNVPAASAVGAAAATPVTIYCISSSSAPISLENPRQRSAWAYPQKYGPRSPTFSRACVDNEGAHTLFISGTSSIVGHESAHAGDQCEQTRETLRNIRTMIDAANERVGARRFTLPDLQFKVYVRRPEHQPMIERELRREVGDASAIFLQADICRSDLLVEIEAVGTTVSG
jgi:chorismate lyase/3-hydroxybenzoate synthase